MSRTPPSGRRPVFYAALVLAALAALYVGRQLAAQALQPEFRSFTVTPTLAEARDAGRLVATYRTELSDNAATSGPPVEAVYAVRPARKRLGPLLQTQTVEAEAVQVVARLGASDGAFRLVFDDGAGVRLRPDGTADRGGADGSTSESDRVQCCFAMRAEAPARFWLERDGERLATFVREG